MAGAKTVAQEIAVYSRIEATQRCVCGIGRVLSYYREAALSVDMSLDFPQHVEQTLEARWLTEDHLPHIAVVLLQFRQAGVRRHESERARLGLGVACPGRREKHFLVPGAVEG